MEISNSIDSLKGIGPKRKKLYNQLGIEILKDALFFFPRRYEDTSNFTSLKDAKLGEKASFNLQIIGKGSNRYLKGNRSIQNIPATDGNTLVNLTFFNQPYMLKYLKENQSYYVYGKLKYFNQNYTISSPKIESRWKNKTIGKIIPIYSSTKGLRSEEIRKTIQLILNNIEPIEEILPEYLIKRYDLMSRWDAFKEIHNPKDKEHWVNAYQRLVFEEFLLFQLALLSYKSKQQGKGISFKDKGNVKLLLNSLPFELTTGQYKVWNEIKKDMQDNKQMYRLIQGDVGSGKTILALMASVLAIENGYQVAFMAPTSILAKQHYHTALELLEPLGMKSELLISDKTQKEKQRVMETIETGLCDLIIGTHALIEDRVIFNNLGLTITDEQHRFGVQQRQKLQEKMKFSDHLVMSATPIPRTLGLVLYGDMDISTIETMPMGRKPVKTIAINESGLKDAYKFMKTELEKNRQIYVICPLIEENETLDLDAATKVFKNFSQDIFSDYKVALLHGKLPSEEKNNIMEKFEKNEIQILVSTTVIEVGVNVPNANCLFVYNAERFGLSQLHQLRGRVGRGEMQAHCILYTQSDSEIAWKRLKIMEQSTDGFYIAEKDLELRGFGDFFGTRQSGLSFFKLGNPLKDSNIMNYAQNEARAIIAGNHLNYLELPKLTKAVMKYHLTAL